VYTASTYGSWHNCLTWLGAPARGEEGDNGGVVAHWHGRSATVLRQGRCRFGGLGSSFGAQWSSGPAMRGGGSEKGDSMLTAAVTKWGRR
jgi:hypothetical protein